MSSFSSPYSLHSSHVQAQVLLVYISHYSASSASYPPYTPHTISCIIISGSCWSPAPCWQEDQTPSAGWGQTACSPCRPPRPAGRVPSTVGASISYLDLRLTLITRKYRVWGSGSSACQGTSLPQRPHMTSLMGRRHTVPRFLLGLVHRGSQQLELGHDLIQHWVDVAVTGRDSCCRPQTRPVSGFLARRDWAEVRGGLGWGRHHTIGVKHKHLLVLQPLPGRHDKLRCFNVCIWNNNLCVHWEL